MSRRTLPLLAAALLASAAPLPGAVPAAGVAVVVAQETPSASPSPVTSSGLPQYAPPPRTMRHLWPVFAGFALTFAGIAAYLVAIGRKMGRVSARAARAGGGVGRS